MSADSAAEFTSYPDMLGRVIAGEADVHEWVAGPEAKIGAGVLPIVLRETEAGSPDVPEVDLTPYREYDPQYRGVVSPEDAATRLEAYHAAMRNEAERREAAMGWDRMAPPARTAIEAAIDSQRVTPVYQAEAGQPAADAWAGQPNSAT